MLPSTFYWILLAFFWMLYTIPSYAKRINLSTFAPFIPIIILCGDTWDIMFLVWVAIIYFLLVNIVNVNNSTKITPIEIDYEKLAVFAKKHRMPLLTAKRMLEYSDKFTDEEQEKMYMCKKVDGEYEYNYVRNENNDRITLTFFDKVKLKPKLTPEEKELVQIIKEDIYTDREKNNIKILNKMYEALKDYKYDNGEILGVEKYLNIINEHSKKIKDNEEKQTNIIKKIVDKEDITDKNNHNIKIWETIIEYFKDYKFDDGDKIDMELKKRLEITKKIVNYYNEKLNKFI